MAEGEDEVSDTVCSGSLDRTVELGPVEEIRRTLNLGSWRHIPKPEGAKRERRKRREAAGRGRVNGSEIVYVHSEIGTSDRPDGCRRP